MKIYNKTIVVLLLFLGMNHHAQILELNADIKARFEYRHGYNSLFVEGSDPAAFVNQRTRLNASYSIDNLDLHLSFQDVSVWGDTRQILAIDGNDSFSMYQAWVRLHLNNYWKVKLGRQEISYDNERIFGALDWAMQGRFHDALLIEYRSKNNKTKIDIGGAYSQEEVNNEGNVYSIQGFFTYKTMQYIHFKTASRKINWSFLALNTGFQNFKDDGSGESDGVSYFQTVGYYFKAPINNLQLTGSAYYQFGESSKSVDLSAYQVALEVNYLTKNKNTYGLGMEWISGTSQNGASKNHSFFPLYGTNHKFNGFMDYFYVGNHANSTGLNDYYVKCSFNTGKKSGLLLHLHYFGSNASLLDVSDRYLGTEIDVVYKQKLMKYVDLNIGYSQMFASNNMSLIKNNISHKGVNNWGWIQLRINPSLFKTSFKK